MATPIRLPIRGADAAGDAVRQTIRAYHGSPYDWDKVDMSMVGKGEGPLDEGFGFYASEQEGVGNWYRRHTTYLRRQHLAKQLRVMREAGRASPMDPHAPGQELEWHRKNQLARRLSEETGPLLQRLQRQFPRGRTYELEVDVPPSSLMDWDAPMSQQPEVYEVVQRLTGGNVAPEAEGALAYLQVAGGNIFDGATARMQRLASEKLFDNGIPGHRYAGGGGQKNFVFYPGTEDQIRILRKYGLLAPMAAAGTMGEE